MLGPMHRFYYRLGYMVAEKPWTTIFITIAITFLCCLGLYQFRIEKNAVKLWIPDDSPFMRDTNWLIDTFEQMYRMETVLITAPDVLEPSVLKQMQRINDRIQMVQATISNGTEVGWKDVCFKIPYISNMISGLSGGQNTFNPSVQLPSGLYCPIIDLLQWDCFQSNILELWKFDTNTIDHLTKDDVLNAINTITVSPTSGHETNFIQLLGGIERNSSGHIIGARSLLSHWMVFVNVSNVNDFGNDAGTQDWASEESLAWEAEFLNELTELERNISTDDGIKVFYMANRSFGDISSKTMFQDMNKVFIGVVLMFIYLNLVLSKGSWTEIRVLIGSMGLISIGMSFIAAVGICSMLGIVYGPVHTCLPFMLLGIGVDDIFVLMACFRQINATHSTRTIAERLALTLQHSGSSVTVTSMTDFVAFLVAATTVLPSLRSFCIHCAVGVLLIFFTSVSFMVAVLALDQRRVEASRNGCLPCIQQKVMDKNLNLSLTQKVIKVVYTKFVFTTPGKIIAVTLAILFAAFGLNGVLQLNQKFDPMWLVPENTYFYSYQMKQHQYYPDMGYDGSIFLGRLNYTQEMQKILQLIEAIEDEPTIVNSVKAWPKIFNGFVKTYYDKDLFRAELSDEDFRLYLSKFLFSSVGGKFQAVLKFDRPLKCGERTGNITGSMIDFRYNVFAERNDYVPAMHRMESLVAEQNFNGYSSVWAKIYGEWLMNEIVDREMLRNVILSLVCVVACTSIFILNIQICFYIFICVLLTLINVCGFIQFWGQYVDLITCVALELAVGLCVDYAAHVGHTFLSESNGSRHDRAVESVLHIGAAIFYGGTATLLPLAILANSEAYTFQTFFKVFFLVIVFGLFNGVVVLPVVLSVIGPKPHKKADIPAMATMNDEREMVEFLEKKMADENELAAKDSSQMVK